MDLKCQDQAQETTVEAVLCKYSRHNCVTPKQLDNLTRAKSVHVACNKCVQPMEVRAHRHGRAPHGRGHSRPGLGQRVHHQPGGGPRMRKVVVACRAAGQRRRRSRTADTERPPCQGASMKETGSNWQRAGVPWLTDIYVGRTRQLRKR